MKEVILGMVAFALFVVIFMPEEANKWFVTITAGVVGP